MPFEPRCRPPDSLVPPLAIDPSGTAGPTRGEAAGPKWRRAGRNAYVPVAAALSVEQRILEQAHRLPSGGAVTGWAALRLAGAAYFDGLDARGLRQRPVPLAIGRGRDLRAGLGASLSREPFAPDDVVHLQGVPCLRPVRALFDEMRAAEPRGSVVAMDMTAAAGLVSISAARRFAEGHGSWRRARRVRWALDLADEDARSPKEVDLRLIWQLDAGLPRPLVNRPVFDLHGRLLGVPDLFDPIAGLVGEYDGAQHREARRHTRDVTREDAFRRVYLEYVKVTALDMKDETTVVDRILTTRARAKFSQPGERAWTLDLPPDWLPRESIDDREAHLAWLEAELRRERGVGPDAGL